MKFVSHRDIVIRSAHAGRSVEFKKGVPTEVPPRMHKECLEKGLMAVDENNKQIDIEQTPVLEPEKKIIFAPDDGDERELQILQVIEAIVKRNNPKEFTGGGSPSAAAVSSGLGWKTDQKDVNKVFAENREALLVKKAA